MVFGSVDSTSGRGRADKKNAIVELTLGEHKDGMNIPFCRECGVVCVCGAVDGKKSDRMIKKEWQQIASSLSATQ